MNPDPRHHHVCVQDGDGVLYRDIICTDIADAYATLQTLIDDRAYHILGHVVYTVRRCQELRCWHIDALHSDGDVTP